MASAPDTPGDRAKRALELLRRLGSGEQLIDAPLAMGLSQEEARTLFAEAAAIVQQSMQQAAPKPWPSGGSILDWQAMTVAEALDILSSHSARQEAFGPPSENSDNEGPAG